ncbi:unnamed protein product [Leptosia nina]|uniref:Uncharacterized protein n=1 Tax=Leptosia nina TaxID=320188 RepID=A0AAV1JEZ4_9NEOP
MLRARCVTSFETTRTQRELWRHADCPALTCSLQVKTLTLHGEMITLDLWEVSRVTIDAYLMGIREARDSGAIVALQT